MATYLGETVEPVEGYVPDDPKHPGRKPASEGWVWCRWSDGRMWLHWRAQLRAER